MVGSSLLPDAATIASIAAAAGIDATVVQPAGSGVTAAAWRVDGTGGPHCVLVERPDAAEPANLLARAAVLTALAARDQPGARPVGTCRSEGIDDPLDGRAPWIVTTWMPGEPAAGALPAEALHDLAAFLRTLHAIPVTGYGRLEDRPDALRGREEERGAGYVSRWTPSIWPYDGKPLAAHPGARLAPALIGALAALREQLLRYGEPPTGVVPCHTDLNPSHLYIQDGRLAGVIDLGDVSVVAPAFDIASFAFYFGWEQADALLEHYEPNAVLRDVRRAEAQQLGVVLALQKIDKHTRTPDEGRRDHALAFLQETLPLAMRRDA